MATEKCAQCCSLVDKILDDVCGDRNQFNKARKRCTEVDDNRFYALLSLLKIKMDSIENKTRGNKELLGLNLQSLKRSMLMISYCQYVRAANEFSKPDQPQMWKKAHDVALLRSPLNEKSTVTENDILHYALDAALPLVNLVRIVSAKGNMKRVTELSLHLVESLLCRIDISLMQYYNDQIEKYPLVKPYVEMIPFNSALFRDIDHPEARISKAQEIFRKINTLISEDFPYQYEMLNLKLKFVSETVKVESITAQRYTAAKNRAASSKSFGSAGDVDSFLLNMRQEIQTKVRKEVLLDEEINTKIDEAALALLSLMSSNYKNKKTITSSKGTFILHEIEKLIEDYVDRMLEISLSLSETQSRLQSLPSHGFQIWKKAYEFVASVLSLDFQEIDGNTNISGNDLASLMSASASSLIQKCTHAFFFILWNLDAFCDFNIVNNDELPQIKAHLDTAISNSFKLQKVLVSQPSSNVEVFSSSLSRNSKDTSLLSLSLIAGSCRKYMLTATNDIKNLSSNEQNDNCLQKEISDDAIKVSENNKDSELNDGLKVSYGTSFLRFAVAWSGLQQRPWLFCDITQARELLYRAKWESDSSLAIWGRPLTAFQQVLLKLGEADAEGGSLTGGDHDRSYDSLQDVMQVLESEQSKLSTENSCPTLSLFQALYYSGMSRLLLVDKCIIERHQVSGSGTAEDYAKKSLESLFSIDFDTNKHTLPAFWTNPTYFLHCVSFQICHARCLAAESMIQSGKYKEAELFLEEAFLDYPDDYDAAIALGAQYLRSLLVAPSTSGDLTKARKKIHGQLLKATKIDRNRPEAYSLLGISYELQGDTKRAVGCHAKGIILDPCDPVSGRGLLRLKKNNEVVSMCRRATKNVSPVIGWAWKALGKIISMEENNDEEAIIFFQKALRCKDIQSHQSETSDVFYIDPTTLQHNIQSGVNIKNILSNEIEEVWSLLALSYRRLGKYSASLRAYTAVKEQISGNFRPATACEMGQVELDLGQYNNAVVTFNCVLATEGCTFKNYYSSAAYGKAMALFYIAKRDSDEGKFGTSLHHLINAIEALSWITHGVANDREFSTEEHYFRSSFKLLGDIYSFGESLPPKTFSKSPSDGTKKQIAFVAKGADAYMKMLSILTIGCVDGGQARNLLLPFTLSDIATNYYKQANLVMKSSFSGNNHTKLNSTRGGCEKIDAKVRDLLDTSISYFTKAIDSNPEISQSWCGLGCAFRYIDPLLSQHCFCRSLQIDKSSAECWTNLAMLYIECGIFDTSAKVLDSLNQVADSPYKSRRINRKAKEICD